MRAPELQHQGQSAYVTSLCCGLADRPVSQRALYTICDYPVTVDNVVFPAIVKAGLVFSALAVSIRMAVRIMTRNVGWDDGVMLLSMACAIGISVLGLISTFLLLTF